MRIRVRDAGCRAGGPSSGRHLRVETSRPDSSVLHAAASGGARHNGAVTIDPYDWFPEAKATSDTEARFLDRLRQLAARWSDVGLSPADSAGAPVGLLVGVVMPQLTAPLRWLWIQLLPSPRGLDLYCAWGDDTRLNDWGPIDGNVYPSKLRLDASPENLAELAATWVTSQASRAVRREDWDGRHPGTRWIFIDTGAVLAHEPPGRWRQRREEPASTRTEQVGR